MYIHGRCFDNTPIMVVDFGRIGEALNKNELSAGDYCQLNNILARYMQNNMMVPG